MTVCMEKARAMNATHLDFINDFVAITLSVLIWKLKKYGLEKQTARWTEEQLNLWAQRVARIWLEVIYERSTAGVV